MSTESELGEIVDQTVAALNSLVAGAYEPFKALYSHEPDVTVFGGFGAYERGWEQVGQNIEAATSRFRGGHLEIERLAIGMSGDLAYTVWIERGTVRVEGRDEPGALVVRVTHVFRREEGAWKLIHRHGDPIVEKTESAAVLQR
ncbi:MAG: YybH family protein [Chloroflexota bacterium]